MANEDLFTEGFLERVVSAAMRDTIRVHGKPITKYQIGSASKRIAGQLRGNLLSMTDQKLKETLRQKLIGEYEKELERVRTKNASLHKQVLDLLVRCGIKEKQDDVKE